MTEEGDQESVERLKVGKGRGLGEWESVDGVFGKVEL